MSKKTKSLLILGLAVVLSVSMTLTPVMAPVSYAADSDSFSYEDFEGQNVDELKGQSDTEALAEDPELYRYYDVDDSGTLQEKEVELDEVDQFIQKMDANAEGISDTEIAEMSDDMTAVGCGVSGLGKAQIPGKYSKFKRHHCVDISWWQGDISKDSWNKIKKAGVTHVIIRTGYTSLSKFALNMDSKFSNNINNAYAAGLKIGVYHFSQALTTAEAEKEAAYTLKVIENYRSKITLPVVFDYETNAKGRLNTKKLKSLSANGTAPKICMAFCDKIKAAGYTPMLYANYTMLKNYLSYKTLQSKYRIWLANYTTNGAATTYPGDYWMWQYSSSGKVNGLKGSVDINYIFDNGQGGSSVASSGSSGSSASTPSQPPKVLYKAKTTDKLNYRTGPGTNYKKVGTYKKGTTLSIVGTTGNWSILNNGYYVSSKWLKKIVSGYKAKTTTSVNYRTGPGTKYKRVGTYKKGKIIYIVQVKNGWAKTTGGYYLWAKYTKKL